MIYEREIDGFKPLMSGRDGAIAAAGESERDGEEERRHQVTLLFDSWKTATWFSYALTLLACLLVPAFYQYLEDLRVRLRLATSAPKSPSPDPIQTPLLLRKLNAGGGRFPAIKFVGASIFAVNSAIGYMLMLAVMSYNDGGGKSFVVVEKKAVAAARGSLSSEERRRRSFAVGD